MPYEEDVTKTCDRCDTEMDTFRVMMTREELDDRDVEIPERWSDRDEFPMATVGYYRTSSGKYAEYASDDEDIVCEICMENDARFQADR